MLKQLYIQVSSIKKTQSEETIKIELFSIMTSFILSEEIFKRNFQIKNFLENANPYFEKELLPYVYDNKALILGRVLRIIEKQDKNFNYNLVLDIKRFLNKFHADDINTHTEPQRKTVRKKIAKENYTDKLFERFKRGEE